MLICCSCGERLRTRVELFKFCDDPLRFEHDAEFAPPCFDHAIARAARSKIPANVLSRVAQAEVSSVVTEHGLEVLDGDSALLGTRWIARIASGRQELGDASGHPWRAVGCAANHYASRSRGFQRSARMSGRENIAIDEHGDGRGLDDRA